MIEHWRRHYNEVRPHSSLGYLTPNEFAAQRPIMQRAGSLRYLGHRGPKKQSRSPARGARMWGRWRMKRGDTMQIGLQAERSLEWKTPRSRKRSILACAYTARLEWT
jgi:hypothetical protein